MDQNKGLSDLSKQLIHLRKLREKINHIDDNNNDHDDDGYIRIRNKINNDSEIDDADERIDTVVKSPTRKNRTRKYYSKTKTNNNSNNDDDDSKLPSNSINDNNYNNNNENTILQATIKLLLQSIEEQGRLRTLLEYSNDPNVIAKQLENQLLNTRLR